MKDSIWYKKNKHKKRPVCRVGVGDACKGSQSFF